MMDQKILLRNLSLGFLPLLVFIVVDAFFGLTAGLIVAIGIGILEAGLTYWRERRVDRFILFDTALIVLLGLTSLLLHNDIFFKLKPALVELILVILLGISAFTDRPLLIQMSQRYLKGVVITRDHIQAMQRTMKRLFYPLALHTLLIVYAAFFLSTEAWGFISGGLFYILMGILLAVEFWQARRQRRRWQQEMAHQEWFDIVTPEGKIIGRAPRSAVHGNPRLMHPVVHVHILNSRGELLLQKRAPDKDLYPDTWDTAIGGHVKSGESIEQALRRESEEELGISLARFQPLFRYIHRNDYESELVYSFLLRDDGPFYPNRREISEIRFWPFAEIESRLGTGTFTPNFEQEFQMLKTVLAPRQPSRAPSRKPSVKGRRRK
ncbi:MAG: NUDIX domain-containing protein [Calditrichaeota bacterium]|nr:NUDIX domain-containing protein [Calditrichota bacterium]